MTKTRMEVVVVVRYGWQRMKSAGKGQDEGQERARLGRLQALLMWLPAFPHAHLDVIQ